MLIFIDGRMYATLHIIIPIITIRPSICMTYNTQTLVDIISSYGSIFGKRDLLAIDHNHHVGFILELCSKHEKLVDMYQKVMYYNVSEVPGILLLFVSTFCDIYFFHNLMYNTGHFVQSMPKSVSIQKLASYLH